MEFSKSEFVATNVGIINDIKIQLRDQTGQLIEFVDNTKPVVFNLTIKHWQNTYLQIEVNINTTHKTIYNNIFYIVFF